MKRRDSRSLSSLGVVKMVLLKYRKNGNILHTHTHSTLFSVKMFSVCFWFSAFIFLYNYYSVFWYTVCVVFFFLKNVIWVLWVWIDEKMREFIVCVCVCIWGKIISSSMRHLTHIYNIYIDSTTGKISTNFVKYSQRNNIWNIICENIYLSTYLSTYNVESLWLICAMLYF